MNPGTCQLLHTIASHCQTESGETLTESCFFCCRLRFLDEACQAGHWIEEAHSSNHTSHLHATVDESKSAMLFISNQITAMLSIYESTSKNTSPLWSSVPYSLALDSVWKNSCSVFVREDAAADRASMDTSQFMRHPDKSDCENNPTLFNLLCKFMTYPLIPIELNFPHSFP